MIKEKKGNLKKNWVQRLINQSIKVLKNDFENDNDNTGPIFLLRPAPQITDEPSTC